MNETNDVKFLVRYFFGSLMLVAMVLVWISHSSCQITAEGIKLLDGDYSTPEIKNIRLTDSSTMSIDFSKEVIVNEAVISVLDDESTALKKLASVTSKANAVVKNDGRTVDYVFEIPSVLGMRYQLYSEIRDKNGNTLTFSIPFFGFNDRIPCLFLSELRDKTNPKKNAYEYIELYAATSGNLFGLELYSANDDDSYEFPAVEVKKGEYIVVHMRKFADECVDELGNNLSLCSEPDAQDGARDLYFDSFDSRLGSSADVILLRDKNSGRILDALLYCKADYLKNAGEWKKASLKKAACIATEAGVWAGDGSPECAFKFEADTTATTRSFSRKNPHLISVNEGIAAACGNDWYVSTPQTPGAPNGNAYVKHKGGQ